MFTCLELHSNWATNSQQQRTSWVVLSAFPLLELLWKVSSVSFVVVSSSSTVPLMGLRTQIGVFNWFSFETDAQANDWKQLHVFSKISTMSVRSDSASPSAWQTTLFPIWGHFLTSVWLPLIKKDINNFLPASNSCMENMLNMVLCSYYRSSMTNIRQTSCSFHFITCTYKSVNYTVMVLLTQWSSCNIKIRTLTTWTGYLT